MQKTEYLALLRGINVGGNNIIKMNELKKLFAEINCTDVVTYIQSGNIIFCAAEKAKTKITDKIAKILYKKLNSKITMALLTFAEMQEIIAKKPEGFGAAKDKYKYDVIFLIKPLQARDALKAFELRAGVDQISAGKNVLYFSRLIKQLTKSKLAKIAASPIYPDITIRNWNTTEKLAELMAKKRK
ncbi:MAG: DUF1697 domain-containing protein [Candidatus Margulisbacteria bacterium]|nr:DUF1697 domain-containing protein [Candidatus Margulisiibacteriota bacterium]